VYANITRSNADWIDPDYAFFAALSDIRDGARLYVPFRVAGMAIWYGFPRGIRVFFDPRNDCYSASTLRAFAELGDARTAPSRARSILDRSRTDAVLVPPSHALAQQLMTASGWTRSPNRRGVVFTRGEPAR
ncbi:MAG TPA: hypothetical protein VHZ95_01055, partial [Polyangiales bacterium]|nr:hypothetical protein [Polyangiales bacterium]